MRRVLDSVFYNFPCCCGATHLVERAGPLAAFAERVTELPTTIVVHTDEGSWWVPRAYIVFHGITASAVPALATQYTWPAADPTLDGYSWR